MNMKHHSFFIAGSALLIAALTAGAGCLKGESTPTGVAGTTGNTTGAAGTTGSTTGVAGTTGTTTGAAGTIGSTTGVAGTTGTTTGVAGTTGSTTGVAGTTGTTTGVAGTTGSSTGVAGTTGAGGMVVQKLCATKTTLMQPVLVDFENYDGTVTADKYASAFGGATVGTGTAYTGPYAYGDGSATPTLSILAGHPPSNWAVSQTVTAATTWGMGGGLWMGCADASAYKGISFWVRGSTSSGVFSFNLNMESTVMPDAVNPAGGGTCAGTADTCKNPVKENIPLTADWTQVSLLWSDFTPGMSGATAVVPNGNGVAGFGWSVPLKFQLDPSVAADAAGPYIAVPGDVVINFDDFAFIP